LQPIADIHLQSHLRWELENNGHILYVYILTGTLFFILLIIVINYVNLTTARSFERAKEIGIRKTLGAISGSLSIQFYLESILFCSIAMILAFTMSLVLLEGFNSLTDKSLTHSDLLNTSFIATAVVVCVVSALIAGFYPAISLSAFIPSEVLKGKLANSFHGTSMRSILVVVQFGISSILIISSLIVLKQLDFMKNKDLGFDQEALISVRVYPSARIGGVDMRQVKSMRNEFEQISGVSSTTVVSNLPGGQFDQHSVYVNTTPENPVDISEMYVGYGFEEVFDFAITDGRTFAESFSTDSAGMSVIVNESLVKSLNIAEPIGAQISWTDGSNEARKNISIVGVVKDFHYRPLQETIQPMAIRIVNRNADYIVVKLSGSNFQQTLTSMETIYQQFDTEMPFEFSFLDESIAELYDDEIRTLNVFSIFGVLALFLACLGLLGMAIAIMNQKVREVGIRKILGASSLQILTMIFGQFTRLIAIALLIGLPVGYFLMQTWMNEFSYQVTLGFLPFLFAAMALFGVAFFSVATIVLKIARANPIDAVKYE
ncbi:MAG: FtsX-like permease family protein, partial [Cyclobacteriaceae bacterium]